METEDMSDIRDLEAFLANLTVDPRPVDESDIERQINATYKSSDSWMVWTNPPWKDFTRELIEPGYTTTTEEGEADTTYADGALVIRGDVNFWMTAVLPRKFETIPFADLVKTIWPHIDKPTLYPDDGNIYWEALDNPDMEVPGEPYELWIEYPFMSETDLEQNRLSMHADETELAAALKDANLQNAAQMKRTPENRARYFGLAWINGVRLPFAA
jgi:hypothetical protein